MSDEEMVDHHVFAEAFDETLWTLRLLPVSTQVLKEMLAKSIGVRGDRFATKVTQRGICLCLGTFYFDQHLAVWDECMNDEGEVIF